MNHELLSVKNLHLKTGRIHPLRGINFEIHRGEIVALAGESGCGKSLTAQAILQLLPKSLFQIRGEIYFEGHNLLIQSEKQLRKVRGRKIAFVSQDPSSALNPTLQIGTQLVETLLQLDPSLSKKEVDHHGIRWLERMHIGNAAQRMSQYPHELSGGMKQRIAIAMALIGKPLLLIADEPTTALDVTVQAEIICLLKELREEEGLAILLITHDLGVVANCCDRLLVMYAGQLVESGSVDQLFSNPRHPYTQALLQSKRSLMQDSLFALEGTPPILLEHAKGCAFAQRCPQAMKVCLGHSPELISIGSGHQTACWLTRREENKV